MLEVLPTDGIVQGQVLCPGAVTCSGILTPHQVRVELLGQPFHNMGPVDENFNFSIPIPFGWYEVVVHVEHPLMQGPGLAAVSVTTENPTPTVGLLVLLERDAWIRGRVEDGGGVGVPLIPARGAGAPRAGAQSGADRPGWFL